MKRIALLHGIIITLCLSWCMSISAASVILNVNKTQKQTITGFGAACCDGAMCPYGTDTNPVKLLYGPQSKIGLNIMRMEISPSFKGDDNASWSNYNWQGCVPSAKIVKARGGIVFGTPWSPPGDYKTNGTAQGGRVNDKDDNDPKNTRGKLREDCYEKFFPWLNSYLKYMKTKGVKVDAVSIQNEPDWWVNYSGCLYDPQDLVKLVKNHAWMLDRETYPGVRLISGESLGFTQNYTDPLMRDTTCRKHIDIVAGHMYGHAPLQYMKQSAVLATKYGKEVWMTEHSVTDNLKDRLPSWHEQLLFAEELNECMLAGCTGYIYWYMRAHWAFVGTGESKYGTGNKKNALLPRAYIIAHFAKHVTGSTRLTTSRDMTSGQEAPQEYSAYIKGDSLIVMAIDTTKTAYDLKIRLPYEVKSGVHFISTGNETANLYQQKAIDIEEPTSLVTVEMPARSFNTYVFMIQREDTGIEEMEAEVQSTSSKGLYDLNGRRYDRSNSLQPGIYIKDGKKILIKNV
ncbi:MAG: endo-1,4-beta-xylanase xyn5A [Bacteroidaceae bacterium]|nr:endo-1,4-beta-xylanase xyn5A [Bacteroidaceae bacterium]